jgi:uncharacterized membrane protein SpoIIM required for sporulation
MDLTTFVSEREATWRELESLLAAAGRRPEDLGGSRIRRLGALYRSVVADLAVARRRFAGDPVVRRLEGLAVEARGVVYDRGLRRNSFLRFVTTRYWELVRARLGMIGLAAAVLFGPGLLTAAWAFGDPTAAEGIVPAGFLWVTEPQESTDQGLGGLGLAAFSTYVLVNNIRVTLTAFALGVTFGVGTGLILAYNGAILGAVAGLAIGAGNGELLVAATSGHGVLEFSCILVGGGAGLAMGGALLRPGTRTRGAALAAEAKDAALLALGTAPWLALAGFIEGYVGRTGLDATTTLVVGVVTGVVYWGLVAGRGR